jgi:hypothetical protein
MGDVSDEENLPPIEPEIIMAPPMNNNQLRLLGQTNRGKPKLVDNHNFCFVFHRKLSVTNGDNISAWRLESVQNLIFRWHI